MSADTAPVDSPAVEAAATTAASEASAGGQAQDTGAPEVNPWSAPDAPETEEASQAQASATPKEGEQATASEDESRWEWLKTQDPQEVLRRHEKLQGHVGNRAKEQATRELETLKPQLREQLITELATEQQQQNLAKLRRTDPEAYVAELDKLEAEQATKQSAGAEYFAEVTAVQRALPPDVQTEISGKKYGSYREYLSDVIERTVEHRLTAAKEEWARTERPALLEKAKAELRKGAPTFDVDGGVAPGSKVVTDADIARMSLQEYDALFDERGEPKAGVVYRPGKKAS